MPSLAQREPEETDLDDDSFRSCQYTQRGVSHLVFLPSLHIIFYRDFELVIRVVQLPLLPSFNSQISSLTVVRTKECPSAPRLMPLLAAFPTPGFFYAVA